MFGWFKKKPTSADQLADFVDRLAKSQSEDLGLAAATVEHTANISFIYGDFYDPSGLIAKRPDLIAMGIVEVKRLQESGLQIMAVGWIVWTHTFRASLDPHLMPLAKSMWALLLRGAPYAMAQRATVYPLVGFELEVNDPSRIPKGFN